MHLRLIGNLQRVAKWIAGLPVAGYSKISGTLEGTNGEASTDKEDHSSVIAIKRYLVTHYSPLLVPFIFWLLLFTFFQKVQPYWQARECNFPDEPSAKGYNMLLVADPQLIDNHTYPTYSHFALKVSKFTVDNYIYKNYWGLVNHLKPDAIVFLGDLLDNGRESSDKYYEHEFDRFNKIFKPKETRERNIDVIMNVPGNHDIGFGSSVISHSVDRFKDHFGQPNQIITKYNHDLISIDTISLSDTKYETIAAESKVFLKTLQEPGELKRPRIIFDHVPFFRDNSKATCGPRRESSKPIPAIAGYQYQTMIDPGISSVVLGMVRPSIIFSGDDHDYCEVVHEYGHAGETKHAIEINVKSISMAMGIWKPAVELLTLYDKPIEGKKFEVNGEVLEDIPATFEYKMCYLTPPYEDIIFYSIFAFFNFVYLCFFCLKTDKYYTGFAIDEVYKEPKVWDTLKSISTKLLVELVVVESAVVWGVYYGLFSVSYY